MMLKDWPVAERPREKLLQRGAQALSDAELVGVLFGTGVAGKTAVEMARDLLAEYGGIRELLALDIERFCAVAGLGETKYVRLQAAAELARRELAQNLIRSDVLASPNAARRYVHARLRDRPYEVFACLFLDNRHRVIRFQEVFRGTVHSATVHPRELVREALICNAAAAIAVHNHPSGVAEPSRSDVDITTRLKQALSLVDVRLLDHLVVGDAEIVSLSERGYL
ncbi:MAG: DNA repair protein RadC [Gammaproteobacteria bacterium]|nr:DNA repair protein RadC [Gammaproteobacteria bacterium]